MKNPYLYKCRLDRVIDGDTVDVDVDLGFDIWMSRQRIRLRGIDTPESRTRNAFEKQLGLAAKARVIELCSGDLLLESFGKDKYGRILGVLFGDGKNVCATLIKEGHAVEYWGGKKTKVWA